MPEFTPPGGAPGTQPTPDLRALNGTRWESVIGDLWETHCSRFASPFESLSHHDQLSIWNLLKAVQKETRAHG